MVFFFFIMRIAYWRTESYCVLRQCGVNRKKSPRNTIWKLKTLQNCTALPNDADNNVLSLVFPRCTQRTKLIKKKETQQEIRRVMPICQGIAYWFCFTGAETEIHKIKGNNKIKREKNIDRRGQSHIGNVWHLPDPPSFSLPTTFKWFEKKEIIRNIPFRVISSWHQPGGNKEMSSILADP